MSAELKKYQERKAEVLSLYKAILAFVQEQGNSELIQKLEDFFQKFVEEKLLCVVCGEFKEGKSSLINALLNEINADLFPVDADIATGLVSTISYGEEEKVTVLLGERGKETSKQITRAEINDYANEQRNQGNIRQARLLAIESPNSILRDGLVIVDTPGVGGLNTRHTGITYAFIPNSDVVMFVSDVQAPLKAKELEFVKMITRHCNNFIFALTKIDLKTKSEYEEIVANNRQKLANILEYPGEQITIIPVSSRNKLAYLESGDEEDLEDSNFGVLEETLWQILNSQKGYILLLKALGELKPILDELKIRLKTEFEACQKRNSEKIKILERKLQEEQRRLRELQTNNSTWQSDLSLGLKNIGKTIQSFLNQEFNTISDYADEYINNAGVSGDSKQIAGLLEADIDASMVRMGQKISYEAKKLYIQIERATGLEMDTSGIGNLDWDTSQVSVSDVNIKTTGWWAKSLNATRSGMFNASVGSFIGTAIGSLFGGVGALPGSAIGFAIGGLFGGVSGVRQGIEQISEKDLANAKRELSKAINRYVRDCRQLCTDSVDEIMLDVERSMRKQLFNQIGERQTLCQDLADNITESKKLSQEEATQKAKELAVPLNTLEQLLGQINILGQAIMSDKEAAKVQPAVSNVSDEDWADG